MQYWNQLAERVAKMKLRERAMILMGLLLIVYMLFDTVSLSPLAARRKVASDQIAQRQNELKVLEAQVEALSRGRTLDPDAANRARLAELRKSIAALESNAKDQSAQLISAERMRSVLQQILAGRPGLELVEFKTLPTSTVSLAPQGPKTTAAGKPEAGPAAEQTGTIYKHGVQLTVRGRYLDLLGYLKQIESLPVKLYWDKLELTVLEHPTASMRVTLYTISLDKAWIQV